MRSAQRSGFTASGKTARGVIAPAFLLPLLHRTIHIIGTGAPKSSIFLCAAPFDPTVSPPYGQTVYKSVGYNCPLTAGAA